MFYIYYNELNVYKIKFFRFELSVKFILYICDRDKEIVIMNPTIDTYRLTSLEEPSDAVLSQLMKEAAEDAKRTNDEATYRFFEQIRQDAQKITSAW